MKTILVTKEMYIILFPQAQQVRTQVSPFTVIMVFSPLPTKSPYPTSYLCKCGP